MEYFLSVLFMFVKCMLKEISKYYFLVLIYIKHLIVRALMKKLHINFKLYFKNI